MANDDIYYGETGPRKNEYYITGYCGVVVFVTVFVMGIRGLRATEHIISKYFFIGISLMAICELPRYILFSVNDEYESRVAYAFHILGGAFFFASLSSVCYMWSCVLQLGPVSSLAYSKNGLLLVNLVVATIQAYSFVACLTSPSLSQFFHSNLFVAFVVEEILQSLIYSTGLSIFGAKLIIRLQNHAATSGVTMLRSILVRLTVTLGITSLASLLRLLICVLQICSLKSSFDISSYYFPHYGSLWFTLAEFLPRGVSSIALMLLMKKGSHHNKRVLCVHNGRYALQSSVYSSVSSDGRQSSMYEPRLGSLDANKISLGECLMHCSDTGSSQSDIYIKADLLSDEDHV